MESEGYSQFEEYVEVRLVSIFREIDTCLTKAYDQRLKNENPDKTLKNCKIKNMLKDSLDCSYTITDQLFQIAAPIKPISTNEIEQKIEVAETLVIQNCPTY